MLNKILSIIFAAVVMVASANANTWTFDKAHTEVKFSVAHLVITDVTGRFKDFDGKVESAKPDFSDAKIELTAKTASVWTDNDKRDEHLRSDDFFNSAQFPVMKFVGKSMKPNGKNKYKLTGDLTIRNVTKSVTFDVVYRGTTSAWGTTKAGFKLSGKINRFDYGLKFDKAIETGELVVGKDVEIICDIELNKAK
jgi:polyisoprenoid-binding protein YceI